MKQSMWSDEALTATTLITAYIDAFGEADGDRYHSDGEKSMPCLRWTPETIEMEIRSEFNSQLMPGNYGRLMSAISVLTTDTVNHSIGDFGATCIAFSGSIVMPNMLELPEINEIAWGLREIEMIRRLWLGDDGILPYTEEIRVFIAETARREGVLRPPPSLAIIQDTSLDNDINRDYGDDPVQFAAIWKIEKERTDDIEAFVAQRFSLVMQQLRAIPFRRAKPDFVNKIERALSGR